MILLTSNTIPENFKPVRFIDYVLETFPETPTRSSAKKAIKRGMFRVNGEKQPSGLWLKPGMQVELYDLNLNPPKILPLKLQVIYEDDYLAVIVKPAGISVSGNKYVTIQNALMYNLKPSESVDAMDWPKPVHRLDFSTTGLLLIAKTAKVVAALGKQFESKIIRKKYRAIV